jgi:hypothetical protein
MSASASETVTMKTVFLIQDKEKCLTCISGQGL